jgi:hypothetical protein
MTMVALVLFCFLYASGWRWVHDMKVELEHAATISRLQISPGSLPADYAWHVLISLHASLLVLLFSHPDLSFEDCIILKISFIYE